MKHLSAIDDVVSSYLVKNNCSISLFGVKVLSNYFTLVSSNKIQAGDIMIYDGHVQVYCMKNSSCPTKPYVYNCGGNASIKCDKDALKSMNLSVCPSDADASQSRYSNKELKGVLRIK